MFWFILVVMVAVLGAAALVALGSGGALPEAEQDRIAVRLPSERVVRRQDVDDLRLPMALRGYRMDEVDDVLDRLGAELAQRDMRIAELEGQLVRVRGAGGAEDGYAGYAAPRFPDARAAGEGSAGGGAPRGGVSGGEPSGGEDAGQAGPGRAAGGGEAASGGGERPEEQA